MIELFDGDNGEDNEPGHDETTGDYSGEDTHGDPPGTEEPESEEREN